MIDLNLRKYLDINLFKYSIENDLVKIDSKLFYFHNIKKPILPDNKELSIVFNSDLLDVIIRKLDIIDFIIYKLGPWYMYTSINSLAHVELEELKYLGSSSHTTYFDTFLGIHGRYERMCGIGEYSEWVRKAKFLKYTTLGICERGTLGGTLQFQNTCKKNNIKSIIGYTLPVETSLGYRTDIKLYVKNEEGWENLLLINKYFHESGDEFIIIESIDHNFNGLICILEPNEGLTDKFINFNLRHFEDCFLQIGGKEYSSNLIDKNYLHSLQKYNSNLEWQEKLPPILVHDAYCLDKEHVHLKDLLLNQSDLGFRESTKNHYFQSSQQIILDFISLFANNSHQHLITKGIENLDYIKNTCNFTIGSVQVQLPTYEMNNKESLKYSSNEDLFIATLVESFNKKITSNKKESWDRLVRELDVIRQGFIDYFLIFWDITKWCREQEIQYGPGRGSAAGSIISYLLGITKINPLDFGLLFERFLNEARLGKTKKKEVVVVEFENNIDIELDFEEEVIIFRNNKQITIKANELKGTDKFIKSTNLDTREN